MKLNAIVATTLLVVALGGSASGAFAQAAVDTSAAAEAQAQLAVKVTTGEAIAAAETASGGKAVEVSLDLNEANPGYRVTVLAKDGTETNYLVDATTGTATLFIEDNGDEGMGDNDGNRQGENGENGREGQGEGSEVN